MFDPITPFLPTSPESIGFHVAISIRPVPAIDVVCHHLESIAKPGFQPDGFTDQLPESVAPGGSGQFEHPLAG